MTRSKESLENPLEFLLKLTLFESGLRFWSRYVPKEFNKSLLFKLDTSVCIFCKLFAWLNCSYSSARGYAWL